MDLGDRRDEVVLEPLDHVHLPQRTAPVERPRHHLRTEARKLVEVAGCRQGDASHVVLELDVGILDPERMVELERDLRQPPAERRQQVEPALDQREDLLEGVATGHGGRVEHARAADVHVVVGRLHVEERRVEARESLHHCSVSPTCRCDTNGQIRPNWSGPFGRG